MPFNLCYMIEYAFVNKWFLINGIKQEAITDTVRIRVGVWGKKIFDKTTSADIEVRDKRGAEVNWT